MPEAFEVVVGIDCPKNPFFRTMEYVINNVPANKHFEDDVPLEEKTRRLNEIIDLQNRLSHESNKKDVGKVFEVLIEGTSKKNKNELFGRTPGNKVCVFPACGHKAGDYVYVLVESCTSATLIGKITNK